MRPALQRLGFPIVPRERVDENEPESHESHAPLSVRSTPAL